MDFNFLIPLNLTHITHATAMIGEAEPSEIRGQLMIARAFGFQARVE
jgi:hypothetical protein